MNLSNHYLPIPAVCGRTAAVVRAATFALLLGAALPLAAQTACSSKFIQTFLVYYGGGPALVASDAQKPKKYHLIDNKKMFYNNHAPTTWAAVKALNPNIQIYLYDDGTEAANYQDTWGQEFTYGLGRYNVSRGHSMGSLNGNHPELFQLDSLGNRAYSAAYSITAGLHGYGQKLWCNRGMTNLAAGAAAWLALDSGPTPPDVVGEEGAFAVR